MLLLLDHQCRLAGVAALETPAAQSKLVARLDQTPYVVVGPNSAGWQ